MKSSPLKSAPTPISTPEINFVYHSLLDDDGYISLTENNGEIVKPTLILDFLEQ